MSGARTSRRCESPKEVASVPVAPRGREDGGFHVLVAPSRSTGSVAASFEPSCFIPRSGGLRPITSKIAARTITARSFKGRTDPIRTGQPPGMKNVTPSTRDALPLPLPWSSRRASRGRSSSSPRGWIRGGSGVDQGWGRVRGTPAIRTRFPPSDGSGTFRTGRSAS